MMKLLFPFLLMTAIAVSAQQNTVKQFLWLEGTWKQDGAEHYEKWQKINDTMIGGIRYHYAQEEHEEDEIGLFLDEHMRLTWRNGKFFYSVEGHNQQPSTMNELEVEATKQNSFTAKKSTPTWSEYISYRLKSAEQIVVSTVINSGKPAIKQLSKIKQ